MHAIATRQLDINARATTRWVMRLERNISDDVGNGTIGAGMDTTYLARTRNINRYW